MNPSEQLDLMRQKLAAKTITDEELRDAIKIMRANRSAATELGAKRKVSAEKVNVADLLKKLE